MHPVKELFYSLLCPPPHYCYLCQEERIIGDDGLCDECRNNLKRPILPAPTEYLDGLTAGVVYTDEFARLLLQFKNKERLDYAPFLSQFIHIPKEWYAELLVPVPLYWKQQYIRTYNQCYVLSEYISSEYGIPICAELLKRTRETSQQKSLSGSERRKNLKGAFEAAPECAGRTIVLIDDVVTTGSTLNECAKTLKKAGARRVYGACIACSIR